MKRPTGILTRMSDRASETGCTVRKQTEGPTGSAPVDLVIRREGHPTIALQTKRRGYDDTTAATYSRWADGEGAELVWMDPLTPPEDIERRIDEEDTDASYYGEIGWCGTDAWNGRIRVPVDAKTQLARYDGAWHGGAELFDLLASGGLVLHTHPRPYYLRIVRLACWKCGRRIVAWLCPDGELWAKEWREEQRFSALVSRWVSERLPGERPCAIMPRYAESVGCEYQGFTCQYCWALQGDWFIADCDTSVGLVLPDSRVSPWLVSHSSARGCWDGFGSPDVWELRREHARRVHVMSERLEQVRTGS